MAIDNRMLHIPISLILATMLIARIFLVSDTHASTVSGVATVSLSPAQGSYSVGQTFPVKIKINPHGENISSIQVVLYYNYTGSSPPIEVEDADNNKPGIQIQTDSMPLNYDLQNSNIAIIDTQAKKVSIIVAGFSLSGYTESNETTLATIRFKALSPINSQVLSFDTTLSKITRTDNGMDILQTPTLNGNYQVVAGTSCPSGNLGNLDCDSQSRINEKDLAILLNFWNLGNVSRLGNEYHSPDISSLLVGQTDNKVDSKDLDYLIMNWTN